MDPRKTLSAFRGMVNVARQRREYERQRGASRNHRDFPLGERYPCYSDRAEAAGVASGHYFHQDLMVAREVFLRAPLRHIDVGSSIYGFVSHLASFRDVEVMDIRPMKSETAGIHFVQQDVMELTAEFHQVADSVSCLHALEHFGLGRYGDRIDYDGWRKGLDSLANVLVDQGVLYLSVPTGRRQRTEFNAHRVFSLPFLRDALLERFDIERLAFVDDVGRLHDGLDPHSQDAEESYGADYGCSIWILKKTKVRDALVIK